MKGAMQSIPPAPPSSDGAPQASASDPPVSSSGESRLGQRQKAWLGMAAVAVALVLLTLMPEPEVFDPHAPPPPADAAAGAEPDDASVAGKPAPLNFTLKDMNGIDVKLESFKRRSAFFTWLYRIAFNLAISHQRRKRPTISIDRTREAVGIEISPVDR